LSVTDTSATLYSCAGVSSFKLEHQSSFDIV
jgi:hypothetical protein